MPPLTLPSTEYHVALLVLFLGGLVVFAAGTLLVRSASAPATPRWIREIVPDGDLPDASMRAEIAERLGIVGESWCIALLEVARREERDPDVLRAVEDALRAPRRGIDANRI